MLRATSVRPRDEIRAGETPADSIALDQTARHRRRVVFTAAGGLQFLLDLEHARALRDGDGLVLEDGRIVSAPLEDMYPFLDRDELARNMLVS